MTNPGILNIRKIIRINSAQQETRSTTFSGPNLQGATFFTKIRQNPESSSLEDLWSSRAKRPKLSILQMMLTLSTTELTFSESFFKLTFEL